MGLASEVLKTYKNEKLKKSTYDMQDAYSFDRVGYIIGDAILKVCVDNKYSEEQAEAIFRSKNIRLFMDKHDAAFDKLASKLFSEYLKKNKTSIDKMLKDELGL